MARWLVRVELGDIFHDEDIPFPDRRDKIIERIRVAIDPMNDELGWLLEDLASTEDEDDFNMVWDDIYDWADDNRVWIGTF